MSLAIFETRKWLSSPKPSVLDNVKIKCEENLKLLITGSAGKLGQAICAKFISENHEVIGLDLIDSDLQNSRYRHIQGNMNDQSQLMMALKDCDYVIHSAVYTGDYDNNLNAAFETNVLSTFNMYECIRKLGKIKIVLLSSAPVDKGIVTDSPFAWKSHSGKDHTYDLTKRLQEEIARDYAETFGIQTIVLRLGHVVNGKNDSDFEGNPLNEVEYCLGGWVDKDDVASACILATMHIGSNFEIFNVIGSHQAQISFDTNRTAKVLGWQPKYRF